MTRRSSIVYGLLVVAWCGITGWQVLEHSRVKQAARAGLVNRARDISTTLGLVVRSQRRFGNIVSQERLESALNELVRSEELKSVALLNAAGEVVASAGEPVSLEKTSAAHYGSEFWNDRSATLVNLVDLGTNVVQEGEARERIIVMPRREPGAGTNLDWRSQSRSWWRTNRGATNLTNTAVASGPGGEPRFGERRTGERPPPGRSTFGRPPWMSEDEFKSLTEKQGLHSLVMVLSTEVLRTTTSHDFWLRGIIALSGALAAAGLGIAWRNVAQSSALQIRLVRASELNNHLREMNLAAAGLAHETRNPLNIIRGIAQMISRQTDASAEVRRKSDEITNEVDRVTAQLNEFINYSRPREVRRAAVSLNAIVSDIVRALDGDLEDKTIRLTVLGEELTIAADEQLLRQVLFNLVINAIQAVEAGGHIQIISRKAGVDEATLEVCDNGPGVPLELRKEIFKPYFTMHKNGTGLGLAIVQQIVLAHGWSIECLANAPRGAIFRMSGLKLSHG